MNGVEAADGVRAPFARRILAVAALAWLVALLAAPWLPAPLAAGLYALGSLICHQRAERSFHLAGVQLPVCARCLGIYAGFAVAALFTLPYTVRRDPQRLLIAAAVPTALTVLGEWTTVWHTSNQVRAGSGLVLGAAVAAALAARWPRPGQSARFAAVPAGDRGRTGSPASSPGENGRDVHYR